MLNADSDYCGLLVQNPLHLRWWTLETNNRFGLRDLADQIPSNLLKPRKRTGQHWLDARSRNCHLFETVRRIAYADVKSSRSQEEFSEHVLSLCRAYNVYSPPLRESELRSTARSISRWTWQRRDRFGDRKRRGALKFSPLDSAEPRSPAIKLRQALGAQYAREQRTRKIDAALRNAVEQLCRDSVPITILELSERAAVSLRTIYRRRCDKRADLGVSVPSGAIRK